METTVDRFGRIVIPKSLRELLGLDPGTAVEITAEGPDLVLHPLHGEPNIVVREGVTMYDAAPVGDVDHVIQKERQKRLERFSRGHDE